ncbi:MAG: trehalose-phosphatase [Actinobacteria bacterium]|nr:trehalose-phosphatase [Actinomycetota bacterium]
MTRSTKSIAGLPHALRDGRQFAQRLSGRRPAVFLDYDGTLTPIVDRPEDAVMSDHMREVVRGLAERCTVCVVSGRDRRVVQQLMGIDNLVVAGSHGFDIWEPATGTVRHDASLGYEDLLSAVTDRLCAEVRAVQGALVELKKASVAVHYRLVSAPDQPRIKAVVNGVLAAYPEQLKITPGKMVYEVQPKIDWDKGKAVLHLLRVLGLDSDDVVAVYLGDDITDEDAFRALAGRGIGIVVAGAGEPADTDRVTAADFVLDSIGEVEQFLRALSC